MADRDINIVKEAVAFASKFGFLTQDIFFEFICPRGRSQRYEFWNYLRDKGYFVESLKNPKIFYLSKRSMQAEGPIATRRKYFYHIDHDVIVARVLFSLEKRFKIVNSWIETQLRSAPLDALAVLGATDSIKLPDLVVDIEGPGGYLRVALEVEASAKAKERYRQIAFAYLGMKRVNLIVYLCDSRALETNIATAFGGEVFAQYEKRPAIVQLRDLHEGGLEAPARFLGREMSLASLLATASKNELPPMPNAPDAGRIPVRRASGQEIKT